MAFDDLGVSAGRRCGVGPSGELVDITKPFESGRGYRTCFALEIGCQFANLLFDLRHVLNNACRSLWLRLVNDDNVVDGVTRVTRERFRNGPWAAACLAAPIPDPTLSSTGVSIRATRLSGLCRRRQNERGHERVAFRDGQGTRGTRFSLFRVFRFAETKRRRLATRFHLSASLATALCGPAIRLY